MRSAGLMEDAVVVSAAPIAPPTPRSSQVVSSRARRTSSTTGGAGSQQRTSSVVARKLRNAVEVDRQLKQSSSSSQQRKPSSSDAVNKSLLLPFTGDSPARMIEARHDDGGWQSTKVPSTDESFQLDMRCMRDSARGVPVSARRWGGRGAAAGGSDDDDDEEEDFFNTDNGGEGNPEGGSSSTANEPAGEDAAFHDKLVSHEPIRQPPVAERRSLLTPYVWLSVSPFPHRLPTVVFPPCDKPWEGDAQAYVGDAYVTPPSLDPIPSVEGRRKRIGRKGKYGNLVYSLPEGSVRFSAVLSTFGTAGMAEDSTPTLGTMKDEEDSDEEADTTTLKKQQSVTTTASKSIREAPESDMGLWSVRWCKRVDPEEYKTALPTQKINHFPGTWGIGRKDNLHKHLNASRAKHGPSHYSFHPDAWILPRDERSLARDMSLAEHCPSGMKKNVYIIKQVASACGRQMRLLCNGKIPKGKWIVQRYVHDPLLIYGYKFDLRLYVVVTSYNPLKVYVYEEGLVRFATTPYPRNPKSGKGMKINSVTAHLTNYSINKNNAEAFVRPEDNGVDEEKGSKWVLSTVKRYFEAKGLDWNGTWSRIEDLIIKTLLSVEPDVTMQLRTIFGQRPSGVTNCFELYGFDVLLRDNLDPILMEVNIMPSLSTRCSLLDQRVKANMIADMMTLVGPYAPKKKIPAATIAMVQKGRKGTRECAVTNPQQVFKLGHSFLDQLSVQELECVCQAEEENLRRTHFKRLFPTPTAHDTYKPLFQEVKSLNTLLCEWEKAKLKEVPRWAQEQTEEDINGADDDEDE